MARIAGSGNAVARTRDLQGQLPAVTVGGSDLKLEVDEVVAPR